MSCCGFPPSKEPTYPLPARLVPLVLDWEKHCPGVFQAVATVIGNGNWDAAADGVVPPFSEDELFEVACQELQSCLLQREATRQVKEGPWHVRWGLSKPRMVLPPSQEAWLQAQVALAAKVRSQETPQWQWRGALPAGLAGGQSGCCSADKGA